MLRQILSASLVMTACVSFIPTSANAATLTVLPSGEIPKKVNDSIEFTFTFNPEPASLKYLGVNLFNLLFDYDKDELRLRGTVEPINITVSDMPYPHTIARYTFDVLRPIKDGKPDLFNATISYTQYYSTSTISNRQTPITSGGDVVPVSEPSTSVPEPLTIFGTATALGGGILLKRKSFKIKKT
jgi:hypothetical protein